MSRLHHFITRCRFGWPRCGGLAVHPAGSFTFEQGAEVAVRLTARFGDLTALSAIDLGCGPVATAVSQGVFSVPWRRLTSVELFPPYLEALRGKTPAAREHEIIAGNIEEVAFRLPGGSVDLALMIDVLEHLPPDRALRLLRRLERLARRGVVLFSPVGDVPQEAIDGNELQRHLSIWYPRDWQRIGYDVEWYQGFHHYLTPPADAAWAIKTLR